MTKPALVFLTAALFLACLHVAGPAGATIFSLQETADEFLVETSVAFSVTSAAPGGIYRAAVIADIAPGWHVNSARPRQDYLIPAAVGFDTVPGLTPGGFAYPPGHDVRLIDELMSVYDGRVAIGFDIALDLQIAPGEYTLPVRFTYQPCNDRECRAPQTIELKLPVMVGEEGTAINSEIFATLSGSAAVEPPPDSPPSELDRLVGEYGLWGYFLVLGLAFVTGLLLSFSPCTYPMIPITVSIFAGQERTIGRGFSLSLVYVVTMALVYGVMGLVVSLVGGVFGAWLASPPVVIAIAIVFVVFALSMFGLYELNVPTALRQKLGTARTGGGVAGAILLGIIAALVVSPCVGPFVAGILLYVATHGSPVVGFLTLFVFALGLGTLFVIIGTFSSAIARLPRSGEWMETVKKFFGFVLLLMAVYFLQTIVSPTVTAVVTALLLLALGVFGGGLDRLTPESGFFLRLKKFVGLLALLVGGYLLIATMFSQGFILGPASEWLPSGSAGGAAGSHSLIAWENDLETGLAQARTEGRPVLIDTWATWCVNCRVLEKKTFGHPDVAAEARRFVAIRVQLERADTPITKAFMERFGLKAYSLPTTVLVGSGGEVHRILHGIVNPDDMIAAMRQVP